LFGLFYGIDFDNDVITLTSYELFIEVQDELTKAYYELREIYANQNLGKTTADLSKEDIITLQKTYPFILSEAETY